MRRRTVVAALLSGTAGCLTSGNERDPGPTERRDPVSLAERYEPDIDIERSDEFPVDPVSVFARTVSLLDAPDVEPPATIVPETARSEAPHSPPLPYFMDAFGVTGTARTDAIFAYVDRGGDRIVIDERALDRPGRLELLLAHEATHVVQYRQGEILDSHDQPERLDGTVAYTATIEGTAINAEQAYYNRYDVEDTVEPAQRVRETYRDSTPYNRLLQGPYRYGYRHVSDRVTDPANHAAVYETPPRTSAEVLQGATPEGGATDSLSVDVTERSWRVERDETDRMGELFLRVAFATALGHDRAETAAAGWRNDERVVLYPAGESPVDTDPSAVWVLRFADAVSTDETRRALVEFLDERAERTSGADSNSTQRRSPVWRATDPPATYRVTEIDDRTIGVLVGDTEFVADTAVDSPEPSGSTVSVRTP